MGSFLAAIHRAFHRPETRSYRVTEALTWGLIAVSVLLFATELALDRHPEVGSWWSRFDQTILWLFAVEIFLRVLSYHPPAVDFFSYARPISRWRAALLGRLRYLVQPLNLIDLLTVVALVPELRGLRALRLLRLLRTRRVFRYSRPFDALTRALQDNMLLYGFAFSALGIAVLVGGISIFLVERGSNSDIITLGDGLWWALVTITTVGFGDITPVTTVGRFVGAAMMVSGMFTLALFAGIVGTSLLSAVLSLREEQFRMSNYINHVVICGFDAGTHVLLDTILKEVDPQVQPLVIFAETERAPNIPPEISWVIGDPTKESELDKVRMDHAAVAVLVGARALAPQAADAQTILSAFTIRAYMRSREPGARRAKPLHVIAEILETENVAHTRVAGADEVIETTRLGFSILAHSIVAPGAAELVTAFASAGDFSVFISPPGKLAGLSYLEISQDLKQNHGAILLGFRNPKTCEEQINPPDAMVLPAGNNLVYLAERPMKAPA